MDPEKRAKSTTTRGITPGYEDNVGAPGPIDPKTGQHESYWVLSEEERAKGFVRPVRHAYVHRGDRPKHPLRDLTAEELERSAKHGYVKFEEYPEDGLSAVTGRYWTQARLDGGCGAVTTMNDALAETYARDPKFYGSTFCTSCGTHFPVAEFVWDGTDEVLGS